MDTVVFRYDSIRAQKARIARMISPVWRVVLMASVSLLLLSGGMLVLVGEPLGWLLLGAAVVPYMTYMWWKGELRSLQPVQDHSSIDAILSSDVLGLLPKSPTPRAIAMAAMSVGSGQFFAARFGIGARFLQEITGDTAHEAEAVWREAVNLQQQVGATHIGGSILGVASI